MPLWNLDRDQAFQRGDVDSLCFVSQASDDLVVNVLNGDELKRHATLNLILSDSHTPETDV
jgi:hypothetical protein